MSQIDDRPLVLVADDDQQFREEIIPKVLGRLNARILTAKDVLEAFTVAVEHDLSTEDPLDLIVLDMHMPLHEGETIPAVDGGIQFLRSCGILLSDVPKVRQVVVCPVVVFTAYGSFRNCVRAVQAGAAAYLPKAPQDAYGGPEGGVDGLVETCRRLLARPEATATPHPPDTHWINQNYDWLCQQFGGQWVAFVPASKAPSAEIKGTERGGLVIVSEDSRESLAHFIAGKLPFLDVVPPILFVPATRARENEVQQEN